MKAKKENFLELNCDHFGFADEQKKQHTDWDVHWHKRNDNHAVRRNNALDVVTVILDISWYVDNFYPRIENQHLVATTKQVTNRIIFVKNEEHSEGI